jgi:hypothetical protein
MNSTINIDHYTDDLMQRYNALAMLQNFDAQEYANDWERLAADAAAQDRPALSEMCRSRGLFYAQYQGEQIRIIDGSFSELLGLDENPSIYDPMGSNMFGRSTFVKEG